ncbi:MAG: DUF2244 domain-containing protein [Gammaproteobacteria bacterium]|nr:DUF2244 domain-containing protein [Gammaproteobacteria bacterium]
MINQLRYEHEPQQRFVICPNRSLTWREAKIVVAVIAGFTLMVGVTMAAMGYLLVLPFSGLEALAVAAAFYYVQRQGEVREVVTIDDDTVVVERGRQAPETRVEFQRPWASVRLENSPLRWHPSRLTIRSHGHYIEVGHFLTDGERRDLARQLVHAIERNPLNYA